MQGSVLQLTIGVQFFLLVGYLFYLLFRTYSTGDDRDSLVSYVATLLSLITLGLLVSLLAVSSSVIPSDRLGVLVIAVVDLIGLAALILDLRLMDRGHDSTAAESSPA